MIEGVCPIPEVVVVEVVVNVGGIVTVGLLRVLLLSPVA